MQVLTPELLLRCYAVGHFPMANDRDDPTIYLVDPDERGIIPLDAFHIPRRLKKRLRQRTVEFRVDTAFEQVILACAEPAGDRPRTWLNAELIDLYLGLHERGHAHSVETWRGRQLVGGLYGVALGAAFFGESMFSRTADASKMALVELVARLRAGGFELLDTQFVTEHLRQFGAVEIPRRRYHACLNRAIRHRAAFPCDAYSFAEGLVSSPILSLPGGGDGSTGSTQSSTQTS